MTRARSVARLGNAQALSIDSNLNVGVNSTSPVEKLNVVGVVSATSFFGDGSNLDGITAAGLGTAVEPDSTFGGAQIYYTDKILGIAGTVTVDPPASTNIAYTQYSEISVFDDADLIVADGDDLIPDILGLSTTGITPLAGAGGRVRADNFTNKAGTGAPTFQTGVVVTGVATATTFSGNISGTTGTFTGNVSIGGTLTYEDVNNVDSVGVITARQGIRVGAGQSIGSTTGTENVVYYGDGSKLTGVESWNQFDTWLYGGG